MAPYLKLAVLTGLSLVGVGAVKAGSAGLQAQAQMLADKHSAEKLQKTPGVQDEVDDMIHQLDATETLIQNGRTTTQNLLNTLFSEAKTSQSSALSKKQVANTLHTSWFHCVDIEQNYLEELEDAIRRRNEFENKTNVECRLSNSTKNITRIWESKHFECELTRHNTEACHTAFDTFNTTTQALLTDFEELVDGDVESFLGHWEDCNESSEAYHRALYDVITYTDLFNNKSAECRLQNSSRFNAFCNFSKAYEQVCADLDEFDDLVNQTFQFNGTKHSEIDRVEEFTTIKVGKCHLENLYVLEHEERDCTPSLFNFTAERGPLDRKEAERAQLTAFSCKETRFSTTTNKTWEITQRPAHEMPMSTDYTIISPHFLYVVDGTLDFCPLPLTGTR